MGAVPEGGGGIGRRRQVRPVLLKETTPGEEKLGGWGHREGEFRGETSLAESGSLFREEQKGETRC